MKKTLVALIGFSFLFANDDINQKLDLLLKKVNQLEKRLDEKDKKIKMLQKELNKTTKTTDQKIKLNSCKNIIASNLKYTYHDDIIPYYTLTYTLTNKYPKNIVYLVGNLYAEDKDGTTILKDFVKRNINLPANKSVTITKDHTLNNELEEYLKDEDPKDLTLHFEIIKAKFKDGSTLECGF